MKIKKAILLFIIDMLIVLTLSMGCSKITDPGAVVDAPTANSIAVIGATGTYCTNCGPDEGYTVNYKVIKVEDKGKNISSVPEDLSVILTDRLYEDAKSIAPFRSVLVAEKTGEYWRALNISKL